MQPRMGRRGFLRLLAALGLTVIPLGPHCGVQLRGGWILRVDDR